LDLGHNKEGEKITPIIGILNEKNGRCEEIRSKIMTIDLNLEKKRLNSYGRC
jgi:hypothetical protein